MARRDNSAHTDGVNGDGGVGVERGSGSLSLVSPDIRTTTVTAIAAAGSIGSAPASPRASVAAASSLTGRLHSKLGLGYDRLHRQEKTNIFNHVVIVPDSDKSLGEKKKFYTSGEKEEANRALSFTVDTGLVGVANAKFSTSYDRSSQRNEFDAVWVCKEVESIWRLNSQRSEVLQEAVDRVTVRDREGFFSVYGDAYVGKVEYGKTLIIRFRYNESSSEVRKSFDSQIGTILEGIKADGAVNAKSLKKKELSGVQVEIEIVGKIEKAEDEEDEDEDVQVIPFDIKDAKEQINRAWRVFKGAKSVVIKQHLASYLQLAALNPIPVAQGETRRNVSFIGQLVRTTATINQCLVTPVNKMLDDLLRMQQKMLEIETVFGRENTYVDYVSCSQRGDCDYYQYGSRRFNTEFNELKEEISTLVSHLTRFLTVIDGAQPEEIAKKRMSLDITERQRLNGGEGGSGDSESVEEQASDTSSLSESERLDQIYKPRYRSIEKSFNQMRRHVMSRTIRPVSENDVKTPQSRLKKRDCTFKIEEHQLSGANSIFWSSSSDDDRQGHTLRVKRRKTVRRDEQFRRITCDHTRNSITTIDSSLFGKRLYATYKLEDNNHRQANDRRNDVPQDNDEGNNDAPQANEQGNNARQDNHRSENMRIMAYAAKCWS